MKSFSHTTATRAKYFTVRRWIRFSTALTIITFFSMSILYIPEYFLHQDLTKQHKELHSIAFKNSKQPTNTATIQLAFTKIEKRQKRATVPVALLKKIKSLCKEDTSLESLSLKPHDMQLILAAKNAPALISIADNLTQQPSCSHLYISSLEPKEQRMIATLKSHQEMKNS